MSAAVAPVAVAGAATGPAQPYTVSLLCPNGKKDGEDAFYQSRDIPRKKDKHRYGAFRISKNFLVKNKQTGSRAGVNGIIVQEVKKRSDITLVECPAPAVAEKRTRLRTKEEGDGPLNELTNENVQFMWENYFELFVIADGISVDVDSFENGPICTYQGDDAILENAYPPEKPSDYPYTYSTGTIEIIGRSVFIPLTEMPDITLGQDELYPALVEILPPTLKSMGWETNDKWPANGLPYLPWDADTERRLLTELAESPIFTHRVNISWNLPDGHEAQFSTIVSDPEIPPRYAPNAGGARTRRRWRRRHRMTRRRT